MSEQLPAAIAPASRLLTEAEFHRLADVPPEVEWFANLSNPSTRRSYENAVEKIQRCAYQADRDQQEQQHVFRPCS